MNARVTAANRSAKSSSTSTPKENRFATSSDYFGSNASPYRLHGQGSGFVRRQTATFRQRVVTRVAASNTAITSVGAKCAMKISLTGSLNSRKRYRIFDGELRRT